MLYFQGVAEDRLFSPERPERYVDARGDKPIIFPDARAAMLEDLSRHPGVECLWIAETNVYGQIYDVGFVKAGTSNGIDFPVIFLEEGWVLVHNHPAGSVAPSKTDYETAEKGKARGCGSYICNDDLTQWCIVQRPRGRVEWSF